MDRERAIWWGVLIVASVATAGSLTFSGIGAIGWRGMGLFPCELCWYQRILMYPLPFLVAVGMWRRDPHLAWYVAPMAALGFVVAAYHAYIQLNPEAEVGQCFVGSCTYVDYRFLDVLTIPQLSLIAFALILLGVIASRTLPQRPS